MGFNYRKEELKFKKEWEVLRREYSEAGFSEENIEKMYEFDWEWFKCRRKYENHIQSFERFDRNINNSDKFLKNKAFHVEFDEQELFKRLGIAEEVESKTIYKEIVHLSDSEISTLKLYIVNEFTQEEIGKYQKISQKAVSKRWIRIKNKLTKR